MKKILTLSLFFIPVLVSAFTIPSKPAGFVSDYAGMLTKDQTLELEGLLSHFEKVTTNEIAVVTVPSLDGEPIENLAQEIFTQWGIGKKDKNNGVLLLISLADHKTRIQTGYGVEGDLTDIGTSYIQSEVITPAFRAGDYYGGIRSAVDKMTTALSGGEIVPSDYSQTQDASSNVPWNAVFLLGFVFLQVIISSWAKSKSWWAGGVWGVVISAIVIFSTGVALFSFLSLIIFVIFTGIGLLIDYVVSKAGPRSGGGPGGFWWLGGGSGGGGGFGGFGGGGSGGGGSSGGW